MAKISIDRGDGDSDYAQISGSAAWKNSDLLRIFREINRAIIKLPMVTRRKVEVITIHYCHYVGDNDRPGIGYKVVMSLPGKPSWGGELELDEFRKNPRKLSCLLLECVVVIGRVKMAEALRVTESLERTFVA